MSQTITVTVGPKNAQFVGENHLALQAALDYVARLRGGTVRILPGTYQMGNSLFLRSNIHIVGSGDDTVLRKCASARTRLTEDTDWYDTAVKVKDPSIFTVGGGILLRGKSPHFDKSQFVKRTVTAIEGNVITIDRDPRENFWIDMKAEAATLFPVVTGDYVNDVVIEDLTIDGNRAENENLNGNYGGGIFIQDCDRITLRGITSRDNNSDGISYQVCDDVVVEGCRCLDNTDLGIHAGSGSQRTRVMGNTITGGSVGFFFCWGVRHGVVSDNTIQDANVGISIGHRDTDNLIQRNTVTGSKQHGILFREHPIGRRDPHRNVFEDNAILDCGARGDCVAIEMLGTARGVTLRGNRIGDTRRRSRIRKRIGLRIGPKIKSLKLQDNDFEKMDEDVVDLRGK